MEILIEDQQKKINLNAPQIKKIIAKILLHENVEKAVLSFVFVTHQKIRTLNQKFLNRNYATDVLAFDAEGQTIRRKATQKTIKKLNGDVIISTDAVIKNSRLFKTTTEEELTLYIVHGILHLLGYDDHCAKDIKNIREKEDQLIKFLGNEINRVIK